MRDPVEKEAVKVGRGWEVAVRRVRRELTRGFVVDDGEAVVNGR